MVDDHYEKIIQFLTSSKASEEFTTSQKKQLLLRAANFQLIVVQLYKMGSNEILCRYFLPHEHDRILAEVHDRVARGDYGGRTNSTNILRAGLWWPIMHSYATDYAKNCEIYQRKGNPS